MRFLVLLLFLFGCSNPPKPLRTIVLEIHPKLVGDLSTHKSEIINTLTDFFNEDRLYLKSNLKKYWHPTTLSQLNQPAAGLFSFLNNNTTLKRIAIKVLDVEELNFDPVKQEGDFLAKIVFYSYKSDLSPMYMTSFEINYKKGNILFKDPLLANLMKMKKEVYKNITIYHKKEVLKNEELEATIRFNNEMADFFATSPKTFSIVVGDGLKEIREIMGFDYALDMHEPYGGEAHPSNLMIFSGNNSVFYPHEIVHLYTSKYNPLSIYNEGVSTYFGGTRGKSLNYWIARLQQYLVEHPNLKLNTLNDLNKTVDDINLKYVIGALLVKIATQERGEKVVFELLQYPNAPRGFSKSLIQVFGITDDKLQAFLLDAIKNYEVI